MPDSVHKHVASYIEIAARTTTRSREILILIIIVSVLVFGAFWNSRQGSWINSRIARLSEAQELRLREEAVAKLSPGSIAQVEAKMRAADPALQGAREYLELRPSLHDATTVALVKQKLEDIQTEHVLYVKLPFFGLFMDVNDLGMLGGFTFIVLLLWFRSSLWHEFQNIRITFDEARTHHERRFCYEALSMQQVLTTPAPIKGNRTRSEQWSLEGDRARPDHWSLVVKALLLLPLVVHLTVFCFDSFSFQYGWSVSPSNTIIGTTVSAVFLLLIAWLTYLCFNLAARVNEVWRTTADQIRNAPPEEVAEENAQEKNATEAKVQPGYRVAGVAPRRRD